MKTGPNQKASVSVEAIATVLEFVREFLRSKPIIPFHRDELYLPIPAKFAERLGEPTADKDRVRCILSVVLANLEERCPGLQASTRENLFGIDLSLKESTEWADVLRFAHGVLDPNAAPELSPAGAELLERVESGELSDQFRSEVSVRHRIRFYGHSSHFSDLIAEIRIKRGIELKLEEQNETYDKRKHFLKFSIASRPGLSAPPLGLNPILPNGGGKLPSRREFQRWFWQSLIDAPFSGSESRLFWSFSSRKEFFRCLPHYAENETIETDKLVELLQSVRGHSAVRFGWDFDYHSYRWHVEVGPATNWEETRRTLREELARPSAEAQYGLSPQAAALFEWVSSIKVGGLELGLTPVIEKAIKDHQLTLDSPWAKENFRLFLTLLCEEVSERTNLSLEVVDWSESRDLFSRIKMKEKPKP